MEHRVKFVILGSLLVVFFLGTRCQRPSLSSRKIYIDEKSKPGIFHLFQKDIEIPTVDYTHAIFRDALDYPQVDFQKFDRSNPGLTTQNYEAVILENKYIRLTLLPGKGKPYSFVYKVTEHEEFFIPKIAQVLGSPNRLGWWYGMGGVEYTMPDKEHGDTWVADWEWKVIEDSPLRKTVRMTVQEHRYGLREDIDISIVPDKAYFEALIKIENPTDKSIDFQHWINPMWAPGGRGEITEHTEFVIPTRKCYITERSFNEWMLDYDADRSRLQPYDVSPLRFLQGWKNIGDLLAWELDHGFYSAFSHDEDEGIVRVFPREMNPGCNIWAWGIDPKTETRLQFSGSETCLGYVEMWGGLTHGFEEYYRLEPGEWISWKEWMFPYHRTGGLHFANRDFAVTFTRRHTGEYVLRLCPSGDIENIQCKIISARTGESRLNVHYDAFYPKKRIPKFSFSAPDEELALVVFQNGIEVVRLSAEEPVKIP